MNIRLLPQALNQSQVIGNFQNETIVKGKVLELLPDNLAVVLLGNEKLTTKVEGFLKRDTQYFFQVTKTTDPVTLKVIDLPPQKPGGTATLSQLILKQLNLPDTSEMEDLVKTLNERRSPLIKDNLMKAAQLMARTKNPSNLVKPLIWMMEKQLPLNPVTIKLVEAATKPTAKPAELFNNLSLLPDNKSHLTEMLQSVFKGKTIDPPMTENNLFQFMKTITNNTQFLDRVMPFIEQFINENKPLSSTKIFPDLNLQDLPHMLKNSQGLSGVLFKLIPDQPPAVSMEKLAAFIKRIPDLMLIYQNELGVKPFLKEMFSILGLHHENQMYQTIQQHSQNTADITDNMKTMLLQLVQNSHSDSPIHTHSETVLQQLTLQQLQFIGNDKGWTQFVLHLPLPIRETFKDASFYWEGKAKEDGSINSDHCHILCYLDLDHLKETLVQIRIQDRYVSLTIHNHAINLNGELKKWENVLKEQLAQINYHLVSLNQKEDIPNGLKNKLAYPVSTGNNQLDVKI